MYILDFIKVCLKNKKMVIVYPIIAGLLAILVATFYPKTYYSEIRVRVDDANSSLSGISLSGGASSMGSLLGMSASEEAAEFYLEVMISREIMEKAVKKFKLDSIYKKTSIDLAIKEFSKDFTAEIDDNGIVYCGYEQRGEELVRDLPRFFIEETNLRYDELQKERLEYNTKFIREKRDRLLDSMVTLNTQLSEFYKENNIVNLENQLSLSLGALAGYEQQLSGIQLEKKYAQMRNPKTVNTDKYDRKIRVLRSQFRKIRGSYKDTYKPSRSSVYLNVDWGIAQVQHENLLLAKIEMLEDILKVVSQELVVSEAKFTRAQKVAQVVQDSYRPDWKVKPKRAVWAILAFGLTFILLTTLTLFKAFLNGEIGNNEAFRKSAKDIVTGKYKES